MGKEEELSHDVIKVNIFFIEIQHRKIHFKLYAQRIPAFQAHGYIVESHKSIHGAFRWIAKSLVDKYTTIGKYLSTITLSHIM